MPELAGDIMMQGVSLLWILVLTAMFNRHVKSQDKYREMVIEHNNDLILVKSQLVDEQQVRYLISEKFVELKLANDDIREDIKSISKDIHILDGTIKTLLGEIRRG